MPRNPVRSGACALALALAAALAHMTWLQNTRFAADARGDRHFAGAVNPLRAEKEPGKRRQPHFVTLTNSHPALPKLLISATQELTKLSTWARGACQALLLMGILVYAQSGTPCPFIYFQF